MKQRAESIASGAVAGGPDPRAFYDRIELVTAAIHTVRDALIEGVVLVTLVFFSSSVMCGAIVVTVSLLVTPLITFVVMQRLGLVRQPHDLGRTGDRHRRNRRRLAGRGGKYLSPLVREPAAGAIPLRGRAAGDE